MNRLREGECGWRFLVVIVVLICGFSNMGAAQTDASLKTVKVRNNFVTELLSVENAALKEAKVFTIENPRKGWLFFRSKAWAGKTGEMTITITPQGASTVGKEEKILTYRAGDKRTTETMRFLPKGAYLLRVKLDGATLEALTVRSIPAIIYDVFPGDPHLARMGRYDWAFLKRTGMLDSCNVICVYDAGHYAKEWARQGRGVLHNAGVPGLQPPDVSVKDSYKYWIGTVGMNDPLFIGSIADEFYPSLAKHFPVWVEAIKRVRKERPEKVFYPYIAGGAKGLRPLVEPLAETGCIFAYERYLPEKRTEKEAKEYLERRLKNAMVEFNKYAPGFAKQCIYVLGFLCGPRESCNKNPAADYKVYLDMQFHLLATDPLFKGLYGVAEYRSTYCDEEYLRWCAKLFRHYCIEGSTERLTNDPYELKHIRNPDFDQNLEGWTVQAGAPDSIQTKKIKGYGWFQGRYPRSEEGDTFLWMKRNAGKPNVISQQIRNLEPGRFYSVKMYSADLKNISKWQIHQISLEVEGAEPVLGEEIKDAFSSVHPIEKFGKADCYFNYHRIVFKATSNTARLIISDEAAPVGQELTLNFIEVEPYLMPE